MDKGDKEGLPRLHAAAIDELMAVQVETAADKIIGDFWVSKFPDEEEVKKPKSSHSLHIHKPRSFTPPER